VRRRIEIVRFVDAAKCIDRAMGIGQGDDIRTLRDCVGDDLTISKFIGGGQPRPFGKVERSRQREASIASRSVTRFPIVIPT
jgi:hypothetical protein